jgi:hypothetical protein
MAEAVDWGKLTKGFPGHMEKDFVFESALTRLSMKLDVGPVENLRQKAKEAAEAIAKKEVAEGDIIFWENMRSLAIRLPWQVPQGRRKHNQWVPWGGIMKMHFLAGISLNVHPKSCARRR